ncbi:tetratricopeptide repeat protein [Photobacterium sp. J15]|uniref:tetratricopeptide repeat protein n=1 Tax=Photobacterium sp. J15 TaxID=265901 RepID=UPI0007E3B8C9|nr:sel1 repeat family protein [Photobacterium sp. J15]
MLKPPYSKKLSRSLFLLSGLLIVSGTANAGYSIVRVKCDKNDTETRIFINNEYKGTCPKLDIPVKAGKSALRAQKKVDDEHEQIFVKQLNVVQGVPQRIDVVLGAVELTASAKKARQRAAEKQLRQAAQADLIAARSGDVDAMAQMVQRYTVGEGIAKNLNKARYWQQKRESVLAEMDLAAAKAGNITAMTKLVKRYEEGKGVAQSDEQAQLWRKNIESANAQAELTSAKAGNVKAMESVSKRYKTGKGFEQSTEQAQYWQEKIDEVKQQKVAQAKRKEIRKEIDGISYTRFLEGGMEIISEEENPFAITLGGPLVSASSTLLDVISTPINMTRQVYLSEQLAAHASAWAKPDSMMAKAYQQQQIRNEQSDDPLLASR